MVLLGLLVIFGIMIGFGLIMYYVVLLALKLAGLARERRTRELTYAEIQAQDEWWATLSHAERKAWNARERRKWRYVALRKKFADEVTRRQQAWYDEWGKLPDFTLLKKDEMWSAFPPGVLTRIANEAWADWKMSEWDDINLAPDRPPCAWSQGGVIDYHYPKPPPAWEPPEGWKS